MKRYYVYILLCSDGLTYTGITNDVARRFHEHQMGLNKNCFTFKRRPVELIFEQEFNDVVQAIYFEKKLKKWSGKKKLALANGQFDLLQILAECRNASHSDYNPEKGN
ncbi:GIY-YIG nuclease family protein [Maribacter polysaccharolyticus]|uniref:GIY-YIG nuclease family protein n=1 Tax=Maribacter polysaccharolyticus TaxID=3020831 RepID=UPI00237F87F3|nr:GIY-YIG nuclease family protein [Maribacter polysaccharolyticus]MDE3740937.1 GIY-YIG nuclease family protein [Maribacter polysaccharolyticus]